MYIKVLLEYNGRVLITVYEGDKSGRGKKSKDDCYRRNARTAEYIRIVSGVIKMMVCDYCGKEITGGYYKRSKGFICGHGDCFKKQFWKDTLDNNVIIINGTAYHKDTTKKGLHCNVKFADGTIKDIWLWYNGIIPKEYNKKDNAEFV